MYEYHVLGIRDSGLGLGRGRSYFVVRPEGFGFSKTEELGGRGAKGRGNL